MRRIFILVILTFFSLFIFSDINAAQAPAGGSAYIEYEKGIVISMESLNTNQRSKYTPLVEVINSIFFAVYEIKCVHPDISFWELFKSGMNVENDTMGIKNKKKTQKRSHPASFLGLFIIVLEDTETGIGPFCPAPTLLNT